MVDGVALSGSGVEMPPDSRNRAVSAPAAVYPRPRLGQGVCRFGDPGASHGDEFHAGRV